MTPARVLLVDDREGVRHTLRDILETFGCEILSASDGTTALELLATQDFDVIFLDLMLPDVSGIEILRKARESGRVLGKVIVLTGLPDAQSRAQARELGVFRYLTKTPIGVEEVRKAFAEATSDSPPPRAAPSGPAPDPYPAAVRRLVPRQRSTKPSARRPSLHRVLVLDDDRDWLETIEREMGSEFDFVLTTSIMEACRWAKRDHFALVILDLKLPGNESGLEVLARMRRYTPDLRAIILSGHTGPDSAMDDVARKRGALAFVSKGSTESLAATVRKFVDGSAAPPLRLFLSHARMDAEQVEKLYGKLVLCGMLPWMDTKNILGGKKWEPEIQKAISECDFFIFCNSRHSLDREGMIRKELRQALERGQGMLDDSIFIIPVRLDDAPITEPLGKYQCVDLFERDGFKHLLRALSAGSISRT